MVTFCIMFLVQVFMLFLFVIFCVVLQVLCCVVLCWRVCIVREYTLYLQYYKCLYDRKFISLIIYTSLNSV